MLARSGDERLERIDGVEARIDSVEGRFDCRIDSVEARLGLVRTELQARMDLLRADIRDDTETMLKLELGGRATLAHAEIDRLRTELDEIGRRLEKASPS